jgi:sugar phosphate isomerase/epimerase
MKLGVADWLPQVSQEIDTNVCRRVRDAGFRGSSLYIREPLKITDDEVVRLAQAFAEADLDVAQLNGRYETLCNPDEVLRAQGVAGLQALVRIGARIGAPSVYARPGSLNPTNQWWAHPDNHTQATFDRIVDSLKQVMVVAEGEGVLVAIEGHVTSALDSPRRVLELIDAVDSASLRFNFDPVNFVGTIKDGHDPSGVLKRLAEVLGLYVVAAHAKDCRVMDGHVVHISEVTPGTGAMNYPLFLQLAQQLMPDGYFIIEHLSRDEAEKARDFVVPLAKQLGIPLEQ